MTAAAKKFGRKKSNNNFVLKIGLILYQSKRKKKTAVVECFGSDNCQAIRC